jgi:hypothetical protein
METKTDNKNAPSVSIQAYVYLKNNATRRREQRGKENQIT